MHKVLSAIFAVCFFSLSWAAEQEQGINFSSGSFEQVLATAKQDNKLLFVDVYTVWCGPCKTMAKEVFSDPDVGDYFNENFVNYQLNAEDDEQAGPELAEKYDVISYPTFLFFNGDGELVDTAKGALDSNLFLDIAKRANGEGASFDELTATYQSGERGDEFMFVYLMQAKLHASKIPPGEQQQIFLDRISEQAKQYLATLSDQQLINASIFQIIQTYTIGPYRGQSLQEFVIDNYAAYTEIVTPLEVAQYVGQVNYLTVKKLAEAGDDAYKPYLEDVRGKLSPAFYELQEVWFQNDDPYLSAKEFAESTYAIAIKDWALYLDVCQAHVQRMGDDILVSTLVSISKDMLDAGCQDKAYLQKAVEYNRLAYEKKNSLFTSMSYGKLLAKLEDPRAKAVLEDAIAQCDKLGSRAEKLRTELERLLEEISET